jgi:hypothetical protein
MKWHNSSNDREITLKKIFNVGGISEKYYLITNIGIFISRYQWELLWINRFILETTPGRLIFLVLILKTQFKKRKLAFITHNNEKILETIVHETLSNFEFYLLLSFRFSKITGLPLCNKCKNIYCYWRFKKLRTSKVLLKLPRIEIRG